MPEEMKEKVLKFVEKHPTLTLGLMGAGSIATGLSIPELGGYEYGLVAPLLGGGGIALMKSGIEAIDSWFEKHHGKEKKKLKKVV